MKIVHCGLMVNGRKEGLSKAFINNSRRYEEFKLNRQLPQKLNQLDFVPDIVFLQIQNDQIDGVNSTALLGNSLKKLKEKGAFIINWDGDIRNSLAGWKKPFSQYCSLTAFSNERDIKSFAGRSDFLQIGIDPDVFKRWKSQVYSPDIVFMGNDYGSQFPLAQFRRDVVRSLSRRKDFGSYGNYQGAIGNLNADPNNPFPNQSHESKIYSKCKIAISVSHYQTERYTSDRLLRCIGSGAFTLAHYYPGIERDFIIGKHLDVFRGLSDLNSKIDYYLSNGHERETIAKYGYQLIQNNFTYDNMVKNILQLKNKWS